MTVARQGSPILDPDLRSQPLREAACYGLCPLSDSDATLGTEGHQARWMPYAPLRPKALFHGRLFHLSLYSPACFIILAISSKNLFFCL